MLDKSGPEGTFARPSELISFVSEKFSVEIDNGKLDILLGSKKNCPSDDRYLEGLPKVKRIVGEIISSSLSYTTRKGVVSCAIYKKTPTDDRCRYFREADRFYIFCIDVRISQVSVDYRTWNDMFNLFQRNLLLWNDDLKYLGGGMRYNRQRGDDGRMCSLINLSMPLRTEADVVQMKNQTFKIHKGPEITQLPTLNGPPLEIASKRGDSSLATCLVADDKSTSRSTGETKNSTTALNNNVSIIGGAITDAQAVAMVPVPPPIDNPAPLTAAAIVAAVERAANSGGVRKIDSNNGIAGLIKNASAAISRMSGHNSVIASLQGTRRNSATQQQAANPNNNENIISPLPGLEKSATYDLNNSTPGTGVTPQRQGEMGPTSPVSTRRMVAIDEHNVKGGPAASDQKNNEETPPSEVNNNSRRTIGGTAGAVNVLQLDDSSNIKAPELVTSPPTNSSVLVPVMKQRSWGSSLLSMMGLAKKAVSPVPILPSGEVPACASSGGSPKAKQQSSWLGLGRSFSKNSVVPSPTGAHQNEFSFRNRRNGAEPPQDVDDALLKAKSDQNARSSGAASHQGTAEKETKSGRWQDFFLLKGNSGSLRITSSMVQQAAAASSSHVVSNGPTFLDEIEKRRETLAQNSKLGEEGGGRLHFMVVDDTSADRRAIMQMLVGEGQIVSEAVDGMDCLQMYEESLDRGEIIDVIIMDSEMPYVSGKKAATMLRSKGFTGAIFGLLEEGTSFVDLETRSLMASGVDAVLMKPLSLDVLHAEYVAWVASRNGDGEVDNSSNPTGLAVES